MNVALDARLTHAATEPAAPALNCRDAKGLLTVCNEDVYGYIDAILAWGRGMAGQLNEILGLQPK